MRPSSIAVVIAISLAGAIVACSGKKADTLAVPPHAPSAPPPSTSTPRTFAISSLFLGDTTRDGMSSSSAWKTFGYDLDGKVSTRDSTDVCAVPLGGNTFGLGGKAAHQNGNGGIDNAFGGRVIPLLQAMTTHDLSGRATGSLHAGAPTLLFEIHGLTDDPHQTNTLVTGQAFPSAAFGGAPTFTLADDRAAAAPKAEFPAAYVQDGAWVSAPRGDLALHLDFGPDPRGGSRLRFDLILHHAVITFEHSSPHKATNGTIAGVLATTELLDAVNKGLIDYLPKTLCDGGVDAWVADLLRQSSDILSDGTNAPGVACDGISIGIGFEADEIANVARIAPPDPPEANPCPADASAGDAGTDG